MRYTAIAIAAATALAVGLGGSVAHASLMADGLTYTLYEGTTGSSLTDSFTLEIQGINGTSDTEGGRYGVEALAFSPPANFSSATLSGFTEMSGGLNSMGCDGAGNFFCFENNTTPTAPALAADTTLYFTFNETLSSGSFSGYSPDFKIDWVGTNNNYDLVSQPLTPTDCVPGVPGCVFNPPTVPEPSSLSIMGFGIAALGLLFTWRRRAARAA